MKKRKRKEDKKNGNKQDETKKMKRKGNKKNGTQRERWRQEKNIRNRLL